MHPSPLLAAALEAAREAERVIRRHYRQGLSVRIKEDRSPVTDADVEAERVIREVLLDRFPGHGISGEELGRAESTSEYLWLVDPIDGTKSFVRGYPFFSTQIALQHQGELIVGVSNAPLFHELACAEKGSGAYLNGQPIRVSACQELSDSTLSFGNVKTLARGPGWQGLGRMVQEFGRCRGYGDFYHFHLLAAGKLEVVVESDVNILDVAALAVIVREAGGRVTDLQGGSLGLASTSILASNGALHDLALQRLST